MTIAHTFRRFAAFLCLMLMICAPAHAETRTVMGKEYGIIGIRIAKSASARLANINDPALRMMPRSVYLPAGTRLLVLKDVRRDRAGRKWALTVTGDGLLVYVRVDANEHYFPHKGLEARLDGGEPVAVVTSQTVVTSERYGRLTLTPSETYAFEFLDGDAIRIVIGRDKMGSAYAGDATVDVDLADVAIIHPEDLNPASVSDPFEPYGTERQLADIVARAVDLSLDKEDRKRIAAYFRQRFVTRKTCDQEIDLAKSIDAAGELDLDAIFSPVSAKLGISGAYSSKTVFPKGIAFTVNRYVRGDSVVEIKHETIDEKCRSEEPRQRVIASDSSGSTGRIRTGAVEGLGLATTVEGLPVYTCRAEFEALLEMLTLDQTLDTPLATFLVAHFATFKGARKPGVCRAAAV